MTRATDSPMEDTHVHRRLGRYELLRRLALSSTAEVHLARPVDGGDRVAIKRLLPHALEDPDLRARFDRELETAMTHTHTGIVRGLEVIEGPAGTGQRGDPCLVMAYVEGPTLAKLLAEAPRATPDNALAHVAFELAAALTPLHASEGGARVHGDVSARNVVALRSGAFTLLDLGSTARDGDEATDAGTPRYVCPERREAGRVTTRGDIYSVGVLLWELATGRRWPTDDPPVGPPTDTPMGALIARCISTARPANARALRAALSKPSPGGREAWCRWAHGEVEAPTSVPANHGLLAWVALIGALTVATVTAAWFIGQVS